MSLGSVGAAVLLLSHLAHSQQEQWRIWPVVDALGVPAAIGDLDGDGAKELLAGEVLNYLTPSERIVMRIRSGRTGVALYERTSGGIWGEQVVVGDVDGDGFDEFAFTSRGMTSIPNRLQVWSPHLDRMLLSATGPFQGFFGEFTLGLDIDQDGRNEIITSTHASDDSRVLIYSGSGTLLRTLQISQPAQQWMRGLGLVGDIDRDGVGDFGVGLVETTFRGAIQLYSGRTAALIRTDYGPQVGDAIGHQIVPFGDLDRDGTPDYVTSNITGNRGLILIYSGSNGQVLREWVDMQSYPARKLLAGMDYDLDGVPDVLGGSPGYVNGEPTPGDTWAGRVAAYSGRDGRVLWEEINWPTPTHPGERRYSNINLGRGLADLGPQPGSPYPVVVVYDWLIQVVSVGPPEVTANLPRLRALRTDLIGTAHRGTGCASTGTAPDIAVRRTPAGQVETTLRGAQPGVPAWLMLGLASATSWSGRPLPVALDAFGLVGCSLLVAPEVIVHQTTGSAGWDSGYAAFAAPFSVAATGLPIALQWLTLDPVTLAHALSARHDVQIR